MTIPLPIRRTYRIDVLSAKNKVFVTTTVRCLPEEVDSLAEQVHDAVARIGHVGHRVRHYEESVPIVIIQESEGN